METKTVTRYVTRPVFERMPRSAPAYRNRQQVLPTLEQVSASKPVNFNLLPDVDSAIKSAEEFTRRGFESDIYKITIRQIKRVGELK